MRPAAARGARRAHPGMGGELPRAGRGPAWEGCPLFEQRFIVDLDENSPMTLQFYNPNTNKLCYLCEQETDDVYGGAPPP